MKLGNTYYLADTHYSLEGVQSVQRGKNSQRLTAGQLDRLLEENPFRVIDAIRSDVVMDDMHRRSEDLASTMGYEHGEPIREPSSDQRMDTLERAMTALVLKVDRALDNRASTPVEDHCRPQPSHDRDSYVRAHLDRDILDIPTQEGKHLVGDIFVQKLIPKPYMFVDHLEGKSLKQKQDYRAHMTLFEYINGFISMLCDTRARYKLDFMDQIAHLRDVTEDIITCKWPSVRQWSNLIFDLIEKGRITLADSQLIHNYRVRTIVRDPAA